MGGYKEILGTVFREEGTACAKALRQESAHIFESPQGVQVTEMEGKQEMRRERGQTRKVGPRGPS